MHVGMMVFPAPAPDEALRLVERHGVDGLEISLPICPEPLSAAACSHVRACARRMPGRIALHEALVLALAHRDAGFRRALAARVKEDVRIAADCGVRIFTCHTTCTRTMRKLQPGWPVPGTRWLAKALDEGVTADLEESETIVLDLLGELVDIAAGADLTIALENNFREDEIFARRLDGLADILRVVNAVDEPALGVCFDAYKACTTERSLPESVRRCGARLANVHASDYAGARTAFHVDRRAVGEGRIDWPGFMDALAQIGYEGAVVLESLPSQEAFRRSAARLRELMRTRGTSVAGENKPRLDESQAWRKRKARSPAR